MNFLKGPCSWDIALFLASIDRLIIWTLWITQITVPSLPPWEPESVPGWPFPPDDLEPSAPGTRHGVGGLGQCWHTECRAFATWLDFCVLTLPCQSKDAWEGPGRITLEGQKSHLVRKKKTTKLNLEMAQKERIKTLDDFSHLAVLSLLSWNILFVSPPMVLHCFSWRGTRMFFRPLPCS